MTAISTSVNRVFSAGGTDRSYPVNAAAKIYKGALVCVQLSDGMLVDGTAATGLVFAGVANEQTDGGAADGTFSVNCTIAGVVTLAASSAAATDVGLIAYLVDNNTVAVASQTGNIAVGRVVKYNSATSLDVDITGFAGAGGQPRFVCGAAAFTTTAVTKAVSAQGLTTILAAGVTPVIDAGAATANGQLGFTEAGSTGLPELGSGNVTVTRVASGDSGLKFVYWLWGN